MVPVICARACVLFVLFFGLVLMLFRVSFFVLFDAFSRFFFVLFDALSCSCVPLCASLRIFCFFFVLCAFCVAFRCVCFYAYFCCVFVARIPTLDQ